MVQTVNRNAPHDQASCMHRAEEEDAFAQLDAHLGVTDLEYSEGEHPEQYSIMTPCSWSWSDNESDPGSFQASSSSLAAKSTAEFLNREWPKDQAVRQDQPVQQVPKDLLDVIERQDAVINRLATWCQTLEDQAGSHREKLLQHEQEKEANESFRSALQGELADLKASARRKAKEHGFAANVLYEKMQSKVDASVADCCAKHQGLLHSKAPRSSATGATCPKVSSSKGLQQNGHSQSLLCPAGKKATQRPASPKTASSLRVPAGGTHSMSRVQSSPVKGGMSSPLKNGVSSAQGGLTLSARMAAASAQNKMTLSARMAATSTSERGKSPSSPRQLPVSPPHGTRSSIPAGIGSMRSGGSQPMSPKRRPASPPNGTRSAAIVGSGSGSMRSGGGQPMRSSCCSSGPSVIDNCFERSASPPATRQSKRTSGQQTPGRVGQRNPVPSPLSSFGSMDLEIQKKIRKAASSPRTSIDRRAGAGLAAQSRACLLESGGSQRVRTTKKQPLDGPGRTVRAGATSPGNPACCQPRPSSPSAGQAFRFIARSVSPPFERSISPNTGRQGSPTTGRQSKVRGDAGSANRLDSTSRSRQTSASPSRGSSIVVDAQKSPGRSPPRASFAGSSLVMQSARAHVPVPAEALRGVQVQGPNNQGQPALSGLAVRHPSSPALLVADEMSSLLCQPSSPSLLALLCHPSSPSTPRSPSKGLAATRAAGDSGQVSRLRHV